VPALAAICLRAPPRRRSCGPSQRSPTVKRSSGPPSRSGCWPDLGAPSSNEDPFPQLTPREHDVLRLLAQGLSNSVIADRLGLSLKTVNNTSSIFTKLNVGSRTEAAILARDRRLGIA
jgi:DNA-binding NarL/FixJ family response regulator